MIDKNNAIFLLGGHDLEMITIRDLLDEQNIEYFDESQKWGAKLSDYSQRLEENAKKQFYAVELTVDDKLLLDKYSIEIVDHHNEYSDRDASLLQVLKHLKIEPSREQKLIAVNDENHIEGMKCICATKEEIESIRKKDRAAQGITIEQEEVAREEIKGVIEEGNIFVIKSSLDTFTPIVDFYDKRPLLIYSSNDLMYYGDITKLKEKYKDEIKKGEAFHGRGFFGFDKAYLKSKDMEKLTKEILQEVTVSSFVSYHSFMFPFSFTKNNPKNKTLKDQIHIDDAFYAELAKAGWKYENFELEKENNTNIYNEYSYYTKPVRETLYNMEETFEEGETSYYFTKKIVDATYSISILNKAEPYQLKLTDVYLRLFESGIGILVFETENHHYLDFEDILKINEYGRRVYPQFLDNSCTNYILGTKKVFLADKIDIKLNTDEAYSENFHDVYQDKIPEDIVLGNHIIGVLGKKLFSLTSEEGYCSIKPVLDDRMFVVSYAENEELMHCLQKDDENYKKNDDWYRYLFVDVNDKTVQYLPMQKELAQASTYPRWLGWGTMWGITRYSFVALTTKGGRDMILPHAQYHYHQMAIIILAIQASLARFRDEVSELSNLKSDDHLEEKVKTLYEYYIKFVNKLHFRELTSQDQGIELYRIAKEVMCFDKEIKDLDNEIAELHTYVSMTMEKKRNDRLEVISKLGAVFLPPSLLAGIYGMNVFSFNKTEQSLYWALGAMLLSAIIGYILTSKKFKWQWKPFLFSIVMGGIIAAIIFYSLKLIGEDRTTPSVNISNPVVCEVKEDSKLMKKLQSCAERVMMLSKPKGEK